MNLTNIIATRTRKTIYRDGDLTIKVFGEDYHKSDVLNEALNQARVEETGLSIPKLHEVTKIDGKWAIVSDFIEGKTLSTLIAENPEKIDEFMELFVDTQMRIHFQRAALLTKHHDKMKRKINQTDFNATVRYELQTRLDSLPVHSKVLHGDFCPSNVIIDKEGVPFIIDWAHATQGNASADAARTYLTFHLRSQKELAIKYLQLFSEKTDTARQYIERWMPIVAASQSVKGKTEERDFLQNWVNVCEYE